MSVIAERFTKTLKSIIYKIMTADNSKSYLPYLNKLVDQYHDTCHYFIKKKPISADYSALAENIESNLKLLNLK